MYINLRNTAGLTVLAVAALASWYWSRPMPVSETAPARAAGPDVGYYLTGAELLGTDESGRVLYRLSAERIEEVPAAARLRFTGVRVEYQPIAEVPWLVSAASGEAPMDRSYVNLRGGVELVGNGGEDTTIIRTSALRLALEDFVAESDEVVNVWVGEQQIRASGMRAYLKDNRLELESEVHGRFVP